MNEPAFPQLDPNGNQWWGLTKRELFAGMAPASEVDPGDISVNDAAREMQIPLEEYAKDAYANYCRLLARRRVQWADAMIAELQRGEQR